MRLQRQLVRALEKHLDGGRSTPPPGGAVLWRAFGDLSRARSCGAAGPNPISFPEIEAYCRLMRLPLEPHQVQAVRAMDALWIERSYSRGAVPAGTQTLPPRSEHALTPAMFDLAMG